MLRVRWSTTTILPLSNGRIAHASDRSTSSVPRPPAPTPQRSFGPLSSLRNSLMSFFHLLGLQIALLVLYFELSSEFHSAASNIESSYFPSFHGFVCSSFYVLNPIFFFFNHCCVNFFVGIVVVRDIAVLVVLCLSFVHLHFHLQCYPDRHCLFFSLVSSVRFTIFLYLLFVCMMSRSILQCVD